MSTGFIQPTKEMLKMHKKINALTIKNKKVKDKTVCSKVEIGERRVEEAVRYSALLQLFLIYISGKPTNLNKFANEKAARSCQV